MDPHNKYQIAIAIAIITFRIFLELIDGCVFVWKQVSAWMCKEVPSPVMDGYIPDPSRPINHQLLENVSQEEMDRIFNE